MHEFPFKRGFALTRRDPNYFEANTDRLLEQTHLFGPRFVRYLRPEFGDEVVSRAFRKKLIRKVRVDGGDLAVLDAAGRAHLGLGPNHKLPSVDTLYQLELTAQVARYLFHKEDYMILGRRKPHLVDTVARTGEKVIVICKLNNHRSRNLRGLIGSTFFRELFGTRTRVIIFADPTSHIKNALSRINEFGFAVELRNINPFRRPIS